MDKIRIRGGKKIKGTVRISGSKNAALPILISSLLTKEPCAYRRVPKLQDIQSTLKLLGALGVRTEFDGDSVRVNASGVASQEADYELVRKMRASVLVLGPLLARFGHAKVSLPGGCAIGARPVNYHLAGLERLGARIALEEGYVIASLPPGRNTLKGGRVVFEFPSVGATENVLMAATLAEGESVLENCAKEPEIVDLARALRSMGAEIEGEGTKTITVKGRASLQGADHSVIGDRIEAGTYLAAALATGGVIRAEGISPEFLEAALVKFEESGARIERDANAISLQAPPRPVATDLTTLPYPGFPTDMQAQFMAAMTIADGTSVITETIFENRFMHVQELARLGADISIRGNTAVVKGVENLVGAPVMATDLRASACLVIAALCARGETVVNRVYHLDRGYEALEEKFSALGADIERMKA